MSHLETRIYEIRTDKLNREDRPLRILLLADLHDRLWGEGRSRADRLWREGGSCTDRMWKEGRSQTDQQHENCRSSKTVSQIGCAGKAGAGKSRRGKKENHEKEKYETCQMAAGQ